MARPVTPPTKEAVHAAIDGALRKFAAHEARRIEIDVRGRAVVLDGVVASWPEHQAIVKAVMKMPGLIALDDRMLRWEL